MKPGSETIRVDAQTNFTGFAGLSTWRSVYIVVLAFFVLWVVLLTTLPWMFP